MEEERQEDHCKREMWWSGGNDAFVYLYFCHQLALCDCHWCRCRVLCSIQLYEQHSSSYI